ncbi:MAG: restriction endonuclease [Candidatus Aenigmarchaeota archaeon]|nr:restriction endonuclease [Candidatus Aenigmarchaeota archaeon]MCX8191039.1 restriction endonuclease [Candidatus Aenigmarchaeota archaeon]MDW8160305.1 restriction endonuclease [Candidatus Aenigmarchaeota archaeon]
MKLEKMEELIKNGLTLEEAFQTINWQDFEKVVAEIFEKHGFKSTINFVFKTEKKYQIDVLAERGELIVLVDCKQWGKHRYKVSELKKAALRHKERCEEFKKIVEDGRKLIPLIVTLLDECVYQFEGVYIVPLFKLNSFLLEI